MRWVSPKKRVRVRFSGANQIGDEHEHEHEHEHEDEDGDGEDGDEQV